MRFGERARGERFFALRSPGTPSNALESQSYANFARKYTTLVSRVPEYIVVLVTSNFRYLASAPEVRWRARAGALGVEGFNGGFELGLKLDTGLVHREIKHLSL